MCKLKVGDKVRCIAPTSFGLGAVGATYTVAMVDGHGFVRLKEFLEEYPLHLVNVLRFELVEPNPVLTPEEVFTHLRKGTKLLFRRVTLAEWRDGMYENPSYRMITEGQWRIKPEPEVIELNGKKYKLIEE